MSGHSGQLSWPQMNVIIAAAHAHGMQMKKFIQLGLTVHVLCGLCSHNCDRNKKIYGCL